MKIENRLVYIAGDGQEFDSEEMCMKHEAILWLEKLFDNDYFDSTYEYAECVIDNFERIKNIVEGKYE